jgi:uncharacterized protein DUF6894
MRYFFHISDGPKVFPDEVGVRLSSPEEAVDQAKFLAAELGKAGEFCRSSRVLVVDEKGRPIFECRTS